MSDLVERNAVIKELHDMYRHCVTLEDWHINGADAIYRVEKLPSEESEIIRCKDCKYYASYWGRCKHWERISTESVLVAENDFCSRARRKEWNVENS